MIWQFEVAIDTGIWLYWQDFMLSLFTKKFQAHHSRKISSISSGSEAGMVD